MTENTWEIPKQFLTQGKIRKMHTLQSILSSKTRTVGTEALITENNTFIPNIGSKCQLETRKLGSFTAGRSSHCQ